MSIKSKITLVERLQEKFEIAQKSTLAGTGEAAAVITCNDHIRKLICSDMLLEGIHFNLVYDPLKHLGYRLVTAGVSKIAAMNGLAMQILVSVAVSSRFSDENLETLFDGIRTACVDFKLDLAGFDLFTSLTGMTLTITAIGEVAEDAVSYSSGAKVNDLICVSGDLGAAYMGLLLLERERRVFETNPQIQPKLEGYDYILQRRLKPLARTDIVESLKEAGIRPTSMRVLTDGLSSEMLHICRQSGIGARIYLEKIPIAAETFKICEEMNFDAVTAAMNGGDDYELLFTLPIAEYDKIKSKSGFNLIGHITEARKGRFLITPEGEEIELTTLVFLKAE
ncbi:MAG: thiamine-phosphate kinase [Prevotellaceae bacterium]|jgi:thiamine-monophosphate kinase|nr:thiamine-phosphate kinase [Prevotellaceae bacterium]